MGKQYDYQMQLTHSKLNKSKFIKANSKEELNQKIKEQSRKWEEEWKRHLEAQERKVEKEAKKQNEEDSIQYAKVCTQQAEKTQELISDFLLNNLHVEMMGINDCKDHSEYHIEKPVEPIMKKVPKEPQRTYQKYNQQPSLLVKLSKKKMAEFEAQNTAAFNRDYDDWKCICAKIVEQNQKTKTIYKASLQKWNQERAEFYRQQEENNKRWDDFFEAFSLGESWAVEEYFRLSFQRINYPFDWEKEIELEYNKDARIIILDFVLPELKDLPKLKSVSYVKSRDEFKYTYHTDTYMKKKYDSIVYQIVLVIINHIFSCTKGAFPVESIVFNGKIKTIDAATGKFIEPYILSVSVTRKEFEELCMENIEPKAWFKKTKGVAANTLIDVTPVAPVQLMSKTDKRFIDSYAVIDELSKDQNLAAMDWQDFEHLIRELFEKEFSITGGEVKITQASHDGGVDAVAFDPDPIRGGKILIQAKRYTNVVGVSAVRDLYGTVVNEGATKGILVTTSDYGNDAYNFVKDKPITLINGGNLLYLLEKHGYHMKIDIKEAKRILNS